MVDFKLVDFSRACARIADVKEQINFACQHDQLKIANFLFEDNRRIINGFDGQITNFYPWSYFRGCDEKEGNRKLKVAEYLVNIGSNVNVGLTFAKGNGLVFLAKYLIDNGATNLQETFGFYRDVASPYYNPKFIDPQREISKYILEHLQTTIRCEKVHEIYEMVAQGISIKKFTKTYERRVIEFGISKFYQSIKEATNFALPRDLINMICNHSFF